MTITPILEQLFPQPCSTFGSSPWHSPDNFSGSRVPWQPVVSSLAPCSCPPLPCSAEFLPSGWLVTCHCQGPRASFWPHQVISTASDTPQTPLPWFPHNSSHQEIVSMSFKGSVVTFPAGPMSPLIFYTFQTPSPSFKAVLLPNVWTVDCYTVLPVDSVMARDRT